MPSKFKFDRKFMTLVLDVQIRLWDLARFGRFACRLSDFNLIYGPILSI